MLDQPCEDGVFGRELGTNSPFQRGQVDAKQVLDEPHRVLDNAVGRALAHWRRHWRSAVGQRLRDGDAQGLERVLAVGADEHAAAVAELMHAGHRAADRLGEVHALVLSHIHI